MLYKPEDLKLVRVKDLSPGTVARLLDRPDIPFFLKLEDADDEKPRVMILGGELSFMVADWSKGDEPTQVVCEREGLRLKMGESSNVVSHSDAGVIVVSLNGAYISSQKNKYQQHFKPNIDLSTFDVFSARNDESLIYPVWELGAVDKFEKFTAFFQCQTK